MRSALFVNSKNRVLFCRRICFSFFSLIFLVMLSKLVQVANRPVCRCNTGVIRRSFAASTKKDKTKEFVKVSLLLGVSVGTCYATYKYATDIHTHELADEKIFIHTPWLLKKLHKWFPLDCYTPYMVQVGCLFLSSI